MEQERAVSHNPYGKYVEGVDLLATLAETPRRIESMVRGWTDARLESSYAPEKWSARQILVHLAQCELVFASRLRFGLAQDGYVVQPFEQDDWMRVEEHLDARSALDAYLAVRGMNLAMCRRLTPAHHARTFTHPELGTIDVEWVIRMFAGHERHHLLQLETIHRA